MSKEKELHNAARGYADTHPRATAESGHSAKITAFKAGAQWALSHVEIKWSEPGPDDDI